MNDSIWHNTPTEKTFTVVQSADVDLSTLTPSELRCILPTLVQASFSKFPSSNNESFQAFQERIQAKIMDNEAVNNILSIIQVDFRTIHEDILKEQHLRMKSGNYSSSSNSDQGLLLKFEGSNAHSKARIVLRELIRISTQLKEVGEGIQYKDDTELFEPSVHLEEISDILCICFTELPYLLTPPDLSEALLCVKYGPWILCKLIANNPDCFDVVCSSVLSHANAVEDSGDSNSQLRIKTLKMLCQMNPKYMKILRAECVSLCKLAGLAIELSITDTEGSQSDLIPFFTGLLLTSNTRTREWLSDFIKNSQKLDSSKEKTPFVFFKHQLLKEIERVVKCISVKREVKSEDDISDEKDSGDETLSASLMHGISIMRLYCTLKTINGFKFNQEESEMLINLIVCPPPPTSLGVRFVVVGLCTLVACAFLLSTQEREETIINWLKWLIKSSSTFQSNAQVITSYGETLLLIAIHFHGHTLEPIVNLVCSTLGIKLRPASLTKLKILFTQSIFPEKVVAEHALTVPVTKNLNRNMKTFLPVHCILQLMKSRVFTKHAITVKDWLFRQICSTSRPIHPLTMELIESYVHSIVTSINISKSTKLHRINSLKPFSEDDILRVFRDPASDPTTTTTTVVECSDRTCTQMLLMMYSLMYQHELLSNMKTLMNNPRAPREYSSLLYSTIPMKQLLMRARTNEVDFGLLYPPMLRLLATYYPHLCLVEDWIAEEETSQSLSIQQQHATLSHTNTTVEIEKNRAILKNAVIILPEHPQRVMMQLARLVLLDPVQLIPLIDGVVQLLPVMMEMQIPRRVQQIIVNMWMKLNSVIPRKLSLKTVNILRKQPDNIQYAWEKIPEYEDEEIQKDPLIVLRCVQDVFRCPPIFEILLRTLLAYMTASRALLTHHILSNPLAGMPKPQVMDAEKNREELRSALISAQESAAIQILLEVCIPTGAEKRCNDFTTKSTIREIQCQVCSFIHQSFISDPSMAKLIHFQGYSTDLLPVTVPGIPSMHICIDFIPQLLNQPYLEKQLFAVQLISHLSLQYPIPKSFAMCKYVVERMNDLLAALPVAKRNQFFVPALSCVIRMCKAFPPIRVEVTELLLKLGRIAVSQVNKSSLFATPFKSFSVDSQPNIPLNDGEEDFEMDIDPDTQAGASKNDLDVKDSRIHTSLDSDNPATNRESFMKFCSSNELMTRAEETFRAITNFSLKEKLVLLQSEKLPES